MGEEKERDAGDFGFEARLSHIFLFLFSLFSFLGFPPPPPPRRFSYCSPFFWALRGSARQAFLVKIGTRIWRYESHTIVCHFENRERHWVSCGKLRTFFYAVVSTCCLSWLIVLFIFGWSDLRQIVPTLFAWLGRVTFVRNQSLKTSPSQTYFNIIYRFWPFYSFVFSVYNDQFDKLYETLQSVSHRVSKHIRVGWKYLSGLFFFSPLIGGCLLVSRVWYITLHRHSKRMCMSRSGDDQRWQKMATTASISMPWSQ